MIHHNIDYEPMPPWIMTFLYGSMTFTVLVFIFFTFCLIYGDKVL
ncbi:hypothetical protein [Synechococcus phage S-B68]|nr:hypothetical protein [Synechococcus phage S-B68]